jgi:hypothetical protein
LRLADYVNAAVHDRCADRCRNDKNGEKKPETSGVSTTLAEGVLNADNLTLSNQGLSMTISPVTLSTEAQAKIAKVTEVPALDDDNGIKPEVYDFSLAGADKLAGVIELMIPLKLADGAQPARPT